MNLAVIYDLLTCICVFHSESSVALFKGKRDSGWIYYIVGCVYSRLYSSKIMRMPIKFVFNIFHFHFYSQGKLVSVAAAF